MILGWENEELHFRFSFQNRVSSGVSGVTTGVNRASDPSLPPIFLFKARLQHAGHSITL